MKRLALILMPWLMLLFGCASESHITADVPLPAPCVDASVGGMPVYVDTKEALKGATSIEARVRLLLSGRIQREGRLDKLEAALEACMLPDF